MKCTKCGAIPVVGKIMVQNEKGSEELNLCDRCLHDFIKEHPEIVNGNELGQMFNFIVTALSGLKQQSLQRSSQAESSTGNQVNAACPSCKLSLNDLRNYKRVGCSTCYSFYKEEIDKFLLMHCGENSQTIQESNRENIAERLHTELQKAIKLEKFELAAKIRDDLKKLQK